ncbi:flagellar basal body rod protein FlgC [Malaciobacter mytili]|uniref:Flagellar basal-body rod protein FlgC n=1 Tax=Malaciobacter mytili LMG 24559 TaxID=1032238 RepID=A0AAX2AEI5_9BACT|nr:flagellar basal body rod protein FlgC [Malaciobacter mytili]AXH15750.1 flagellar proximal rod protein FlgC [Malaciobacter mytili LMG 24559]RXI41160.1 flagellar basal body rod protein FlgC [Malaciobacter mytili]RXK15427.1 flagellar basal body rod protein FlgC [Malaciobacter mytili LMG 24559]
MGFFDGYNVATSGMSAQRTRINVVSANIANAQTTHTAEGGPYKKQNVVFEDVLLNTGKKVNSNDIEQTNSKDSNYELRGVAVKSVIQSDAKPVMRYEPAHPDANEEGYVAYPDINPVTEMVNLIEATRSYEANIAAFNTHKSIDTKTLEILKA